MANVTPTPYPVPGSATKITITNAGITQQIDDAGVMQANVGNGAIEIDAAATRYEAFAILFEDPTATLFCHIATGDSGVLAKAYASGPGQSPVIRYAEKPQIIAKKRSDTHFHAILDSAGPQTAHIWLVEHRSVPVR